MEKNTKIYEELNELISKVEDVDFLYEIKQQIEQHQQDESNDWADELSDEQRADLELALAEEDTPENTVSWEEYQKLTAKWRAK
jgi:hypothetical protein